MNTSVNLGSNERKGGVTGMKDRTSCENKRIKDKSGTRPCTKFTESHK